MDEGAYRILRATADRRRRSRPALARRAGEAESVVRDVLGRYAKWFDEDADGVRATDVGLAALATEWDARDVSVPADDALARYVALTKGRPPVRRELDQVWATAPSVMARARLLIESGEVQRGLVLLGDDDLTSLALAALGASRTPTVLDVDEALLAYIREHEAAEARLHDLRDPLPKKLRGRFGCAFTDPPYAVEGFELFLDRAIAATRPDARIYCCFGSSRRALERGLAKQDVVHRAGLLVERVVPDFHEYEGAESIGARSDLWVLRKTPTTRRLLADEHIDGDLYTRRAPKGGA